MRRVVVDIERLVLRGFRAEERHEIGAGLQLEMGRLFGDASAVARLKSLGDVRRLSVSGTPIEQGSTPRRVGQSVAQSIREEIGK